MRIFLLKVLKFHVDLLIEVVDLAWPWFWRLFGATLGFYMAVSLLGASLS